jgi:DNA mismatch endonuclease (patch repair protein)
MVLENPQVTYKRLSSVKSKDTKPEMIVRKFLHKNGYRFRLIIKDLPGRPDLVLKKYNSVVFVNGCYWHRHKGCIRSSTPKKNIKFWSEKFKKNIKRDRINYIQLKKMGWFVIVLWECEINNGEFKNKLVKSLKGIINSGN